MSRISPIWIYAGVCAVMSAATFTAFGVDKALSKRGTKRIAEATLHRMELMGGWPGAWLGQQVFRHKTQKASYRRRMALIILLHIGIVAALFAWERDLLF